MHLQIEVPTEAVNWDFQENGALPAGSKLWCILGMMIRLLLVTLFVTLLTFTVHSKTGATKKRTLASLSAGETKLLKKDILRDLQEYTQEELKGARAGFTGARPWTEFIISGENPGWDTVNLVKRYNFSVISLGDNLLTAEAKIVFDQLGELSSNGKLISEAKSVSIPVHLLLKDNRWMVERLPEDLLPQVTPSAAIQHFNELKKASSDKKSRAFYDLALKSLRKL